MTDFRDRFGIELDAAARRLARDPADFRSRFAVSLTEAAVSLAPAPVRSRRLRSLPRPRLPRLAHPLAVALSLTVLAGAAAAASIWLPQLGNPNYGYNPGVNSSPPPAGQLAALGVLRAPQTAADRNAASTGVLTYVNNFAHGVRTDYIRLLGQDATATYLLIPVAHRDASPATPVGLDDALCVYAAPVTSTTGPDVVCYTLGQIESGRASTVLGTEVAGLAPDGVASVIVTVPGAAPLTTSVTRNFFAVTLPASVQPTAGSPTVTFQH
ncbi:MAG: hypothetical protein ACRDLP_13265 [Solirubrobacteraceae bacterium]